MKVEKYVKLKDNRYEVIFDNDLNLKLYDDIIVKYNLISKNNIDDKLLKEVEQDNDNLASYYIALKYINTKLRSEKEVREFLIKKEFNISNIDNSIERLKSDGYLNEKVYLEAYINDQVNLSQNGYYKIFNNLVKLGFDENDIYTYLDKINEDIWKEKIQKLVSKKIRINNKYSGNKLKEKIVYDLANLGHKKEYIYDEIESYELKDDDLLAKEYSKVKSKLEKKYEGRELNYQIKSKLLSKGFNYDDINKVIGD